MAVHQLFVTKEPVNVVASLLLVKIFALIFCYSFCINLYSWQCCMIYWLCELLMWHKDQYTTTTQGFPTLFRRISWFICKHLAHKSRFLCPALILSVPLSKGSQTFYKTHIACGLALNHSTCSSSLQSEL